MTDERLRSLAGIVAVLAASPLVSLGTLVLWVMPFVVTKVLAVLLSFAYLIAAFGVFFTALGLWRQLKGGEPVFPASTGYYGLPTHVMPVPPAPVPSEPKAKRAGAQAAGRTKKSTKRKVPSGEPDPWRD